MKLRNILSYLTILVFVTTQLFANTNPVVTNVVFSISGTTVTVTYDVADAEENTFTVYMEVSDDGGTTWDFDYGTASGAIGASVAEGTGKTITWEYTGAENANFKIKILADDLFGDQIYYSRKTYNTVTIQTQVWLKENLDVGTMITSNSKNDHQTNNSTIEKYCYDNDPANCDTYGGLYQWNEAMKYVSTEGAQGICPTGWHIPTYSDMQILQAYVGNNQATKLIYENAKSGYIYTNETGFSALFAGTRSQANGGFFYLGTDTYFWSSTETGYSGASNIPLNYYSSDVGIASVLKWSGSSVRCIRD